MTCRVELMMALHYACTPLPDQHEFNSDYVGTEALRVWTEAMCEVPEPVLKWEIPR